MNKESLKISSIVIIILLLIAGSFVNFQNVEGQQTNYVFVEPKEPSTSGVAPFATTPGQVVMVNVSIENAVAIYGYNITIYLADPTILEYLEYIFVSFLDEPYISEVRFVGSRFTIYAKSQYPATPVSGSSRLITLFFKAKTVGQTLINFDTSVTRLIKEDGSQILPGSFKRGLVAVTYTKVVIEPEELTGDIGTTLDSNLTVYKVQNLYGVEFKIIWNPEILSLIEIRNMDPWGANRFVVKNETGSGYYWFSISAMRPASAFTGNFTFANLRFNITKTGLTAIKFAVSNLGNQQAQKIAHAKITSVFSNIKTTIAFAPSEIVDVELAPDSVFAVNITVTEALKLKQFEIKIRYPTTIMSFLNVTFNELTQDATSLSDNTTGTLKLLGDFLTEIIGNITVATVTFKVVGYGDQKITVVDEQCFLKSSEDELLLFKSLSCRFVNWRNIRLDRFDLEGKITGNAFAIDEAINCITEVRNVGAREENITLNVTYVGNITANETSILVSGSIYNHTFTLEKVGSLNSSAILTFGWNTTGLEAGVYDVKANISIEVDDFPADNVLIKTVELAFYVTDVSIANVIVMPPKIYVNDTVTISTVLLNLGEKTLNFTLFAYLDGVLLQKFENISLLGKSGDLTFLTVTFSEPGSHKLNFTIPPIPKETALQNNVYAVNLNVNAVGFSLSLEVIAAVIVLVVASVAVFVYLKRKKP